MSVSGLLGSTLGGFMGSTIGYRSLGIVTTDADGIPMSVDIRDRGAYATVSGISLVRYRPIADASAYPFNDVTGEVRDAAPTATVAMGDL